MGETLTSKGRNTRRHIVDVAVKLFRQDSFDNVTIAKICQTADVSNGSFFHYFKEKEDVLYAFVEDESDELVAMQVELDALDPRTALERVVAWQGDYYVRKGCDFLSHFHSHLIASRRTEAFKYAFVPIASKLIERGQREGVFREDVDADLAAGLLFSYMTSMITYGTWPSEGDGWSMKDLVMREYERFQEQVLQRPC